MAILLPLTADNRIQWRFRTEFRIIKVYFAQNQTWTTDIPLFQVHVVLIYWTIYAIELPTYTDLVSYLYLFTFKCSKKTARHHPVICHGPLSMIKLWFIAECFAACDEGAGACVNRRPSGWGWGGFSKVVATFNHVGGSFNLFMATTGDIWIIPSFRIWYYVLHFEHVSCVITNCGQHQWVIPSLSITL